MRDAGAAALCRALRGNASLLELDLGWNAAGRAAALALERALRAAAPLGLRRLRLCNNGLTDADGAVVLDALAARAAAGGGWRSVDLAHNLLEGGAALCARRVVAAAAAAAAAAASAPGGACWEDAFDEESCSGSDSGDETAGSGGSSSAGGGSDARAGRSGHEAMRPRRWPQDGVLALRVLVLDGNPLGASGAQCVLRALAGCHAVADAGGAAGAPGEGPDEWCERPLPLHVSMHGCSLVAGDKGFRVGMADGTQALVAPPQVATLNDAVVVAPTAAGATAAAAAAGGGGGGGATSLVVTERAAGLNLNSPAGRYNLDLAHPATEHLIWELLDLRSRLAEFQKQQEAAGAAAQAAAAAAAAQRAAAAAQEPAAGAGASAFGGWAPPKRRMSVSDYAAAMVRRASRQEAPEAAGGSAAEGFSPAGTADPSRASVDASISGEAARREQRRSTAASRRQTVDAAGAPGSSAAAAAAAGGVAAARGSGGGAGRGLVQRLRPPPVDALSFADIQLDGGRPMKLETLLELKPWAQAQLLRQQRAAAAAAAPSDPGAPPAGAAGAQEAADAGAAAGAAAAGGSTAGAGAGGAAGKKKAKGPRAYQRVSFCVKVAAVVSAEEPKLLPEQLLWWAVKVRPRFWKGRAVTGSCTAQCY